MISEGFYSYEVLGGKHWSFRVRKGTLLRLTDVKGGGNAGMLFYNPENLLERYNAPDTLKCQHTFKLTRGNCLYSDMGRIFCSIVEDTMGWHETVCGLSHPAHIKARWGEKNYQDARNDWYLSGYESFLVELAKYGLGKKDLAANVNFFSRVIVNEQGNMQRVADASAAGSYVELRFEMDTLVVMHTCPHPLDDAADYPRKPILVEFAAAKPVQPDDFCMNFRPENKRGFENNRLYHLGGGA